MPLSAVLASSYDRTPLILGSLMITSGLVLLVLLVLIRVRRIGGARPPRSSISWAIIGLMGVIVQGVATLLGSPVWMMATAALLVWTGFGGQLVVLLRHRRRAAR